jgi:uncharacterized protein YgbK (DUF1537 family)
MCLEAAMTAPLDVIGAASRDRPVVILDDDATGSQAVRDVEVLLRPDRVGIATALAAGWPGFFVLTNSRSLSASAAADLAHRLGTDLADAAHRIGRPVSVVSRSDSTLRGHFPIEVDALAAGLGMREPKVLLAPYFGEGGRVTEGDVHDVVQDGVRTPVAETEYARDPRFGYRSSNLLDWVRERAPGRWVTGVDVAELRATTGWAISKALTEAPPGGVVIVNAIEQRDIELAAAGAVMAEGAGVEVIARTAASFARARLGQPVWPALDTITEVPGGPGLVVVGSHVETTNGQLARLRASPPIPIEWVELDVDALLDGSNVSEAPATAARTADAAIRAGRTTVVSTSRRVRHGIDANDELEIGQRVAAGVVEVVRRIEATPAWIVAKGGITSSHVAADALGASSATVVGQLVPGVSLWRLGPDARRPGLAYAVFPGNVGGPDDLRAVVARLAGA